MLPNFFYHSNQVVRMAALEVSLLKKISILNFPVDLFCFEHRHPARSKRAVGYVGLGMLRIWYLTALIG